MSKHACQCPASSGPELLCSACGGIWPKSLRTAGGDALGQINATLHLLTEMDWPRHGTEEAMEVLEAIESVGEVGREMQALQNMMPPHEHERITEELKQRIADLERRLANELEAATAWRSAAQRVQVLENYLKFLERRCAGPRAQPFGRWEYEVSFEIPEPEEDQHPSFLEAIERAMRKP